jgi:transcriptional regulator with XRE-family HTH domain
MIFLIFLIKMGFRENLKAELKYSDMLVKELAANSGIKKLTIDSYLRKNGYTPSIESAVKIAQALGLSVEYLVTGLENRHTFAYELRSFPFDVQVISRKLLKLSEKDRKVIAEVIQLALERNREE